MGAREISPKYEEYVVKALGDYLGLLKGQDIAPPVFILTTMCGVKGCKMNATVTQSMHPIDRDVLLLPEVVVDEYAIKPEVVMKPAFDAAWNAVGLPGSVNYDGLNWTPQ